MMPTRKAIAAYWSTRVPEEDIAIDWADDPANACWACARRSRPGNRDLHRCHLVPRANGGPDTAENLVILCDECHRLAPDVPDPAAVWAWIRTCERDPLGRAFAACREAWDAGLREEDVQQLRDNLAACGLHHGRLSPATVSWAIEKTGR